MNDSLHKLDKLISDPNLILVFSLIFFTAVCSFLVRRVFVQLEKQSQKTANLWDDAFVGAAKKPANWLIWLIGITWTAQIMAENTGSALEKLIDPLRFISVVGLIAFFLTRFISQIELASIKNGGDVTTANAVGKLLRISVAITAALSILQTLGFSISGILAFGGVGGIAVGFAAKDLLANFFGGLMIYLDRPFAVGDWIRSPDREIEGTVESIGWRLTSIRTFDQRPLYIPNSVFANIAVENPSRMDNRRIFEKIGVRYTDANRVSDIVDKVRKMLIEHEEIDSDQTLIVNLDSFGPSALEFFIYVHTKTIDWIKYHEVKQLVMLEIIDIVEKSGAEFAFPTSTLHIVQQ
ncbi:MAG: mechanosensitive ion channel protein MscS [Gammaproteobacteria bacterium]|nr:mechanosensitive ion channel protein MscS [Gammaproteobacteria bacterium]